MSMRWFKDACDTDFSIPFSTPDIAILRNNRLRSLNFTMIFANCYRIYRVL